MNREPSFRPLSALVSKVANLFKKDEVPISKMLASGPTSPGEAEVFYPKKVIMFLENRGGCDYGRRLGDIWLWDHERLEKNHTYIQWLFPTDIQSAIVPNALVLSKEEIEAINKPCAAQANIRMSFRVYLCFLGLELTNVDVRKTDDFNDRADVWLTENNHNFLRISRVIRCLGLVGLDKEAQQFFDCLSNLSIAESCIDKDTLYHWDLSLMLPDD